MDPTRAARDLDYSPSSCVDDIGVFITAYAERSAAARRTLEWRELRYGPSLEETLDFFPAEGEALHVFIHGGYWQELDKSDSSFAAPDFTRRGVNFAALGYGLAPKYGLDEIVAQTRAGVAWLIGHAPELGVDPRRIVVSGSSAGAHLAAMNLDQPIAGAVLLSGLYELEPLRHTYVGESIGLTAEEAARNSPVRRPVAGRPPVVLARGGHETPAFAWQQEIFTKTLGEDPAGRRALVVQARNHFDLPFDLGDTESDLGRTVLELEAQ